MWYRAGTPGPLPIQGLGFNFMPSWWKARHGIEYGERMVMDPLYRVEAWRAMERAMHARFGSLGLGNADPQPQVIGPDWHNAVTPAAAGAEVRFPDDNYPVSDHLPEERIAALRVPDDITAAWPYREIIRQVKLLNDRLGKDEKPVLPMRGVANDASLIRGADLFGEIVAEPGKSKHLLDWCHGIITRIGAFNGADFFLPNCCVMMVSPATYEEVFLPYDRQTCSMAEAAGQPGSALHHCGTFDRYAASYQRVGKLAYIEIGMDSDIHAAMEAFPNAATIASIMDPYLMLRGTPAAVAARVRSTLEAARGHWGRFYLSVPDIENGTPDENIAAVVETVRSASGTAPAGRLTPRGGEVRGDPTG